MEPSPNEPRRADAITAQVSWPAIRRALLIIIPAVILVAGVAYALSRSQAKSYTASAQLLLLGAQSGTPIAEFAAPTPTAPVDEEALVTSKDVLAHSQAALTKQVGPINAARALSGVSAAVAPSSSIVVISVKAPSGQLAALGANAVAQQNITDRSIASLALIQKALDEVNTQLTFARHHPKSFQGQSTYASYRDRLVALTQAQAETDGQARILQSAIAPVSPTAPNPKRDAAIGAFGGLLLGLALLLLRQQLDRRLRRSGDLEAAFGFPILANVPKSKAFRRQKGQKLLEDLPGAEAEAFQRLRTNLRYLRADREVNSVVVTSTGVAEGKSTVALNLAMTAASSGARVLLIEADIRRPSLGRVLDIKAEKGLSGYLADPDLGLSDVLHNVPITRPDNGDRPQVIDVLPGGPVPSNPVALLDSERMRELIAIAEERYDLVVIDTSPAGAVSDPIALMRTANAVIVVGRVGRLASDQADALREQLQRVDAPVHGLVANFARDVPSQSYSY